MKTALRFLAALCLLFMCAAQPANATLGTTTSAVVAQGNSVTTAFSYNFIIPQASDVVVTITNTTVTPNTITTVGSTGFTITGLGSSAGGTVTYPLTGSPLAPGYYITISRIVPLIQTTSISNQGPVFAAIEAALDYLTMITQQLQTQISVLQTEISGGTTPPVYTGRIIASGSSDTAFTTDTTIAWNSSTASGKTETLYACNAANAWKTLIIKDEIGTAGTYPITLTPSAGNTIDGMSTFPMPANFYSAPIQCSGVSGNWLVE